jgi:AbrB family looped-hinge helix DNA binding protein
MATTVTSKGQVTIPKKVREYLGVGAGSSLDFEMTAAGQVVIRPASGKVRKGISRFAKLRGRATVKMSTDAIMALTRKD